MLNVTQFSGFASGTTAIAGRSVQPSYEQSAESVVYSAAEVSAWQNSFARTLSVSSAGWNGFTLRQVLTAGLLTLNGSLVRLVLQSGTDYGFSLDALYIGEQGTTGDPYDMKPSSPAPARFTKNGSTTINAPIQVFNTPTTVTTDGIAFAIDKTKVYVITAHFTGSTADVLIVNSITGATAYNKSGVNEAATADVTGYTNAGAGSLRMIQKILSHPLMMVVVDQAKSWIRENSTLVYFLIAQLIAGIAAAGSILTYSVRLETRVHILETRGAAYSVGRMDAMAHQIAVLEEKINHNEQSIQRIINQYLKDKNGGNR